jgi:hypothetical protein
LILLTTITLWLTSWHWLLCLFSDVLVVLGGACSLSRLNRVYDDELVTALTFNGSAWLLELANGRRVSIQPGRESLLHPSVVAASFLPVGDGKPRYRLFLIARDVAPEQWRRLQLALRYRASPGSSMVSRASAAGSG